MARKPKQPKFIPGAVSAKIYAASADLKYAIKREERILYEMRMDPNVLAAVKDFYEADGDDAPTPSRNDRAAFEEHVLETFSVTHNLEVNDFENFDGGSLIENQVITTRLGPATPNASTALSLKAWLAVHKHDTLAIHLARGRKDLKVFDARGLKSRQRATGLGPMCYEEIMENTEAFMEGCVSRSFNEVVASVERDAQARTFNDLLAQRGRMNRTGTSSSNNTSTFTPPARRGFHRRSPVRIK